MPQKSLLLLLCLTPTLHAQTYKLGVPAHTHPAAVLTLKGDKVTRSSVTDDPGFRLQFHLLKDGKSLDKADARLSETFTLPTKEPGQYALVLELFYPAYKPGKDQKGQFKAISNFILYQVVSPGAVKIVERPGALILDCGKGEGKAQEAKLDKGYGYKLVQGKPSEGWPAPAARSHAWMDPKQVKFEISVPAEMPGVLRLHLVDGDATGRRLKIVIQGRGLPEVKEFKGDGKWLELPLSSAETKAGKIEVVIETLDPKQSAVVSGAEFVPAF